MPGFATARARACLFILSLSMEAALVKAATAEISTPATAPILLRDEAIAKLKTIMWRRFRATLIFMLSKGGSEPSPQHFETVLFYRKSKIKEIRKLS